MNEITSKLQDLAVWRKALQEAAERKKAIEEQLQARPDYQEALQSIAEARKFIADLETTLRNTAIQLFQESGDKKPHPALGVRVRRRARYDPLAAKQYCFQHLPVFLELNDAAFIKHALAVAETVPLPGVEIVEEPEATIAGDLSDYLPPTPVDLRWEDVQEIPN